MKDERGKTWLVFENDIAWCACRRLVGAGITFMVLPRMFLLEGRMPPSDALPLIDAPIELVTDIPEVRKLVQAGTRLRD